MNPMVVSSRLIKVFLYLTLLWITAIVSACGKTITKSLQNTQSITKVSSPVPQSITQPSVTYSTIQPQLLTTNLSYMTFDEMMMLRTLCLGEGATASKVLFNKKATISEFIKNIAHSCISEGKVNPENYILNEIGWQNNSWDTLDFYNIPTGIMFYLFTKEGAEDTRNIQILGDSGRDFQYSLRYDPLEFFDLNPTETPKLEPIEYISFYFNNVAFGGGYCTDSYNVTNRKNDGFEMNPQVLAQMINAAKPNILGLDEWCNSDRATSLLASDIGMPNYHVYENYWGDHNLRVAIFTQEGYDIVNTKSLKYNEGSAMSDFFVGGIATVRTPSGNNINIMLTHWAVESGELGEQIHRKQAQFTVDSLAHLPNQNIVIAGDMNTWYGWDSLDPLIDAGYTPINTRGINDRWGNYDASDSIQMWAMTPQVKFENINTFPKILEAIRTTVPLWRYQTDHRPEYTILGLYKLP